MKTKKWFVILLFFVVTFTPASFCDECNGSSPCIPDPEPTPITAGFIVDEYLNNQKKP